MNKHQPFDKKESEVIFTNFQLTTPSAGQVPRIRRPYYKRIISIIDRFIRKQS